MSGIRLRAFRLKQKNTAIYVGILPASDLMAYAKADIFDAKTGKGYQRQISTTRARKAGRYLLDREGLFPQSVVLNVRGEVEFRKKEDLGIGEYGELEIPQSSLPLWEVDGQHRIGGIQHAISKNPEFSNYPVNVTILTLPVDKNNFAEMKQFYIINTEMRGVRADLAQQLISQIVAKEGEKEYRKLGKQKELLVAKAQKIVDLLNSTPDQPWFNAIQFANEEKKPNHRITQLSFIVSLKPVLRVTEGMDPEVVARILSNYWNAIYKLYRPAFEKPVDYLIQKTLGVFVFHMIFPRIFSLCGGSYKEENFKRILSKIAEEVPVESWHKEGEYKPYGGMKGFNYLAATLEDFLEGEEPKISY